MPSEKIILAQQLAAQGWPTHKIVQETNLAIRTVENIIRGSYQGNKRGVMEVTYSTADLKKRLAHYEHMVDRIKKEITRRQASGQ